MRAIKLNLSEPEAIVDAFIESWNSKDAVRLASVFVEDAEFVNVTGLWWHSRERIFKAHDYGLKVIFNQSSLKVVKTKCRYLSENIAIVHAKMRLEDQSALQEGQKPQPRTSIFIFVTQRLDGFWFCQAAHNTEIIPGKETYLVGEDGQITAVNYGQFQDFDDK